MRDATALPQNGSEAPQGTPREVFNRRVEDLSASIRDIDRAIADYESNIRDLERRRALLLKNHTDVIEAFEREHAYVSGCDA